MIMTDVTAIAAREAAADAARVRQDNVQRDREAAAADDRAAEAARDVPPPADSGRGQNVDQRA